MIRDDRRQRIKTPVALLFRLNATPLLLISCKAFNSRLSYGTLCLLVLFPSTEDFLKILICFTGFLLLPQYFHLCLLLFRFLVASISICTRAIHKHNTFIRLPLTPLRPSSVSSLLYFIRNFTLSSRILLYLSDFSPYPPSSRVLFHRPPLAFQFSPSLLVHS